MSVNNNIKFLIKLQLTRQLKTVLHSSLKLLSLEIKSVREVVDPKERIKCLTKSNVAQSSE